MVVVYPAGRVGSAATGAETRDLGEGPKRIQNSTRGAAVPEKEEPIWVPARLTRKVEVIYQPKRNHGPVEEDDDDDVHNDSVLDGGTSHPRESRKLVRRF